MSTQRRIYIGDIQGCREELEELLERLRYDPSSDVLQPCGDLVNRGPDSLGVLRLLKQLDAQGVLGNHDVHLLRAARGLRGKKRRDTLDAVLAAPDCAQLLEWLELRPFVRTWPDVVLVHAGISPMWSDPFSQLIGLTPFVENADMAFAVTVRHCDAQGARSDVEPLTSVGAWRPWWEYWQARQHETRTIVFGHWATQGLVCRERVRGLDTGCVWGGWLTAWIAEEERFVQVRARRAYQNLEE